MGRNGSALVFLLPSETSYIQYMDISQKVIMTVLTVDDSFPKESVIDRVLGMLCKERFVLFDWYFFDRFYNFCLLILTQRIIWLECESLCLICKILSQTWTTVDI